MAYLILVRHGQSIWNALGQWTGLTDVPLTEAGKLEAQKIASALHDIEIHIAHTSILQRAKDTLKEISQSLKLMHIPVIEHEALNERNYGKFTGRNKWQLKKELGEELFHKIHRAWNHPIQGGETLKDVYERVVPYFKEHIIKDLKKGKNIIVSSHSNTLRALVKYLDNISEDDVANLEVGTGELHVYKINENGEVVSKEIRIHNPKKQ